MRLRALPQWRAPSALARASLPRSIRASRPTRRSISPHAARSRSTNCATSIPRNWCRRVRRPRAICAHWWRRDWCSGMEGPLPCRARRCLQATAARPGAEHARRNPDLAPNPLPARGERERVPPKTDACDNATTMTPSPRQRGEGRGEGHDHEIHVPPDVRELIEHELALIAELQYEPYFLTVYDIVEFARREGILCQGRGSAAQLGGVLRARHHRSRPGADEHAVRALHHARSATSRPTSTSTSSTSGARR